jgi:hypothetical protein
VSICQRAATVRTIVLLAMRLAVLIARIDTSVVNLATHAIGVTFHTDVASLHASFSCCSYGRHLTDFIGTGSLPRPDSLAQL